MAPLPSALSFSLPLRSPVQLFFLPSTLTPLRTKSTLSSSPHSAFFSSPTSFPYSLPIHRQNPNQEPQTLIQRGNQEDADADDERVIGDCLVFEEGAFEDVADPFLLPVPTTASRKAPPAAESLIPEKWKEAVAELKLTKKEKRKISHELKFGSKMERRKKSPMPDMEQYMSYRELKLSQLKPVVLHDPQELPPSKEEVCSKEMEVVSGGRVVPRNPKLGLGRGSLEDITEFFNSGGYVPPGEIDDDKKPQGPRKLFTQEEKVLLNRRIPNLAEATSSKWLPLHTLAASGEFYLLDMLLKHNVDINAVDKDGLSALHKAILGKKQAIVNYLLRNSANPFIRDRDGATLIHYAVLTSSSQAMKILLLYNVDMNLADQDGWTPLHLAVQTRRTDIVRLLLIKGADRTLKNRDGLTPLELCLYSGHDMRTFELIKLLKELPPKKQVKIGDELKYLQAIAKRCLNQVPSSSA